MSDMISREDAVNAIYHHFPQLSRTDAERVLYEVESAELPSTDLISRQKALHALVTIDTTRYCVPCKEVLKAIRELPPAELNVHELQKDADCISRQATIDYFVETIPCDSYGYEIEDKDELRGIWEDIINKIPSAEPQERKGKWIPDYTDCRGEIWVEWKCSCCGFIRTTGWEHGGGEIPTAKFCEECGCKMEVTDDCDR